MSSESSILRITRTLSIPRAELDYRASRSGGPGGQHANTSSTRVELLWDVDRSPSLSGAERQRIRSKLGNRINSEGVLLLADSSTRSQHRNKEAVTERFVELLRQAMRRPKPRKKTKPTRASRERRLKAKKHRSQLKKTRGPVRREH